MKKIVCLVLSLACVFGMLSANSTYAWFIDYSQLGVGGLSLHNFKSDSVNLTLVGGFISQGEDVRIEPELELLNDLNEVPVGMSSDTKMYIINNSTIETQLRVKVYYTYIIDNEIVTDYSLVGSTDSELPFVAELAKDITDAENPKTYWIFDDVENCFYYNGVEGKLESSVQLIPLFSSLRYSGEGSDLPSDVFAGENNSFNIKVVFEAKQADFVEWSELDTIEFVYEEVESLATTTAALVG